MKLNKIIFGAVIALSVNNALAHDVKVLPNYHAPIGVMGDHTHKKGEWMFSYRYASMYMKGVKDGDSNLTPAQVRSRGFMMAPLNMSMDMNMFGAMYSPNDKLTAMLMLPYMEKDMDMLGMCGALSKMSSDGFGDTKLSAMYKLYDSEHHKVHINAGISFPTGSIDEDGTNGLKLPYSMQLGSGTYDILPGITYNGFSGDWSFGSQLAANIRIDENSDDYSLGDEFKLNIWGAKKIADFLSLSARIEGKHTGEIDGEDPALAARAAANMSPLFRTDYQGGERVDASVGANFLVTGGVLKGHRFAVEAGMPLYENFNGIQVQQQYRFTIGYQVAF
jgi:hypothetical protein